MKYLLLAAVLLAPPGQAWGRAGGGGGSSGGGCFPAGTPVLTVKGEVPIEKIRPGDRVLAFSNERLVEAEVKKFIEKKDRLIKIRTAGRSLTATSEHPLLTRYGFTEVRALRKGDDVALFEDGRRVWAKIRSIRPGGVAKVYNLEVSPPHTFIAGGFIVHNKGGFGGGYSSGYSSGNSDGYSRSYYGGRYRRNRFTLFDLILFGVILGAAALKKMFFGNSYGGASGGYGVLRAAPARAFRGAVLQNGLVMPRAELTLDILKALGRRDPAFNPVELESFARSVFLKVQAAWQGRDYTSLRGMMMPSIHASYSSKVDSMRVRGEINMMEDVQVLHADFVHVRCPREKEGRSFTVLITASAKDYTINERHHNNDQARPAQAETFQEYWTFHQLNGSWALARVDQIGELDYLNAPNLPSDPQGANAVPEAHRAAGAAAAADDSAYRPPTSFAPAGDNSFERGAELLRAIAPAAAAETSAPRPPLNRPQPPAQLSSQPAGQDARWDRQKMEIAATLAFESVYEAWGRGDSARLSPEFVSAEALVKLKKVMADRKEEGLTFELKSLFTRRAEVVLTSAAEQSPLRLDEFTARITATAMRALLRNGKALHRDEAPEPFTEYWVFGRQNNCWKLRDILPRMDQECEDRSKDGAPGPAQIEWYWHS